MLKFSKHSIPFGLVMEGAVMDECSRIENSVTSCLESCDIPNKDTDDREIKRHFPLSRTGIRNFRYFFCLCEMMAGRDLNGVVSVCLYSKKRASRSPNGSVHTLECPQSAQQRSACPGNVQAHFPLGALMEKISAFHLWHHSLHARF